MGEATIRDVARRADVSVASVSRVLNGLDNVSEGTRVRVLAAVGELGYVPHAGARSLSLARNQAIGVVLPDVHGEFFSEIMRGMDREASDQGYLLLLSIMHAGGSQSEHAVRAMRGRVDGLVVMAPHLDAEAIDRAVPAGMTALLINPPADCRSRAAIRLDNAAGIDAVVAHLAAIGRRRIVHVAGPDDNVDARERRAAFAAAIARHLPGAAATVLAGDFGDDAGARAVHHLIERGIAFDAICAANDMMAIGALQALGAAGVQVPDAVAVTGFDDVPLARYLGLTTVRVRIAELGGAAIAGLIAMLEGGAGGETAQLHAPDLVVRATTVRPA
jgi:LacI family transcriptional regulator